VLFIPITIAAATLQVGRNAFQRGLVGEAGPWGATLVRFLFGLPFAWAFFGLALVFTPGVELHYGARFWIAAILAGGAQVGATAALLTAMHRSGFALGAAFQQSSLVFAAIVGVFVLGEPLSGPGWTGVIAATIALTCLSWPKGETRRWTGAIAGLISGACYAVALNEYREANLAVAPGHPLLAATATTAVSQALQSLALGGYLSLRRPQAMRAVLSAWRSSLGAGFLGSAASALWLTALAMAPAAQVRAVGVVEAPISALVGRRLFAERLSVGQMTFGVIAAVGVALASLG